MNNDLLLKKVIEICRSDDRQKFNAFWQYELQTKNTDVAVQDNILRAILSTENIFNSFLTEHERGRNKTNLYVHPLLYRLLNFALKYPSDYEDRIFKILDFGIAHNRDIAKRLCCDRILQNGDLIYNEKIIGRAVVFTVTEPLNCTDKLFAKLDELNSSVRAIRAKHIYLNGGYSGLSVRLTDDLIEKERTFNECEYTFLKLLEENGYSKAPRYLGVKNGKDIFSYIKGETIAYTYEMSEDSIIQMTEELKTINAISKKYLKDKVYVHGDLGTQNIIFDNSRIVGIIDWDNTFIGEEYDDFIYVFWVWANVGNLQRNDERMFELLRIMIDTYHPDDWFKKDFSYKIRQRMERKLKETPEGSNTYKRIYDWVRWSQTWVEKYKDRIGNEIG